MTRMGVDYAVNSTGVPSVIEAMLNLLANIAVTVGLAPAGGKINVDPQQFLLGSKAWLGRREGGSVPDVYIPNLCKLQSEGRFPVEKLCRVHDYKDIELALQDLKDAKVTKPVLR